jgi:hypothetical protein
MVLIHNSNANTVQSYQNSVPTEVKLMIHHQLPGIELVSPIYASDGSTCHLLPDPRVDAGYTAQIGFNIDFTQDESIGALIYKLQRKSADQSNEDTTSNEDGAPCTQLIVIWNVNSFKDLYVYSRAIEQDQGYVWDSDRLMNLAKRYCLLGIQHCLIEETWLTHDGIAFMTNLNVTCEAECYKLEMTISEAIIDRDAQRPWDLNLNR